MAINIYRDLEIWQRAMELAAQAYHLTKGFPKEELFGLTSQIRRAASSIPANIAEGWGRSGSKEFQQFLQIAQGSLRELETHLILAQRVGLTTQAQVDQLLEIAAILGRQLITLQRSLSAKRASHTPPRSQLTTRHSL